VSPQYVAGTDTVAADDTAHQDALKTMQGRWKHPVAGMSWCGQVKRDFAALAPNGPSTKRARADTGDRACTAPTTWRTDAAPSGTAGGRGLGAGAP